MILRLISLERDVIKCEVYVLIATAMLVIYGLPTSLNRQPRLAGCHGRIADEHGKNLIGVVLDLRNNPGALLSEAISVTDAFLDQGEIIHTRSQRKFGFALLPVR